ncbi:MAG: type II toxin-antitoxin system RelE/ParE family toxin [Candidatus Levyibacteriota bacterium]
MQMEIKYGTRFRKQYIKADKKIKAAFAQTLEIFQENPDHPGLRNHLLREGFTGYRSMNVTEDWRAIFKERRTGKQLIIVFHFLGTHKELYKSM